MSPHPSPFGYVYVEMADEEPPVPVIPADAVPVAIENDHSPTCPPGSRCVECGGCDCGLVPRTCDQAAGCYPLAQAELDAYHAECDDGGRDDFDDFDWYHDDDADDLEHDSGDCDTC